jgi:transportin-1
MIHHINETLDTSVNKGLAQNVSITIGKLGLISPESSVDYLPTFIKPFCISLRYLSHSAEKHNAFSGVWESIKHNPKGVIESFDYLCEAFTEYTGCSAELESTFKGILQSFKISAGSSWDQFFNGLPSELQNGMKTRFEME